LGKSNVFVKKLKFFIDSRTEEEKGMEKGPESGPWLEKYRIDKK
jgi:hypothetical protein